MDPTAVTAQLLSEARRATPLDTFIAFGLAFLTLFTTYNVASFAIRYSYCLVLALMMRDPAEAGALVEQIGTNTQVNNTCTNSDSRSIVATLYKKQAL